MTAPSERAESPASSAGEATGPVTDDTVPDPALVVRNLRKTFGSGGEAVLAVDDVSFAVEAGTVVGLLGPNGAGKTTLIKSVLGLVEPDAGRVRMAGVDARAERRAAYRHVGAMLEGARNVYWKLTVRENLAFFAAVGGQSPSALAERHDALLDQLSLADKADHPVNDLSRGQKQKVSLACALAREADVAFLDEPTLGLDVESSVQLRREIRRLADREGRTVVLSSHDMDTVRTVCDRVIVMNDGAVVADDAVEDLVDVFRTHSYSIAVEGSLSDEARERLRDRFDAREFERRADREQFAVALRDPGRFYDLVDELRATGRPVVDVTSVDPDLEDVFLELTDSRLRTGERGGPEGRGTADDRETTEPGGGTGAGTRTGEVERS